MLFNSSGRGSSRLEGAGHLLGRRPEDRRRRSAARAGPSLCDKFVVTLLRGDEVGRTSVAVRLLGAVSLGVASLGGCGSFWGGVVRFCQLSRPPLRVGASVVRH